MYILNIIIHSEFLHDCHMYRFTWLYTVQVPSSAEFLLVNTISATEDMLVVSLKLFYYACNICRQVSQVVHSVNFPTFCNHFTLVDSWIYSNHSPQSAISHYSTLIHSVTFQFLLDVFFSYPDLFPNKTYVIYWNDDISIQRMATLHRVAHISGSVHLCDSNRWILPSCIVSCFSPGWQITISNIILCINRTNIFLQVIVCNSWLLEGKETNNGICCLRFLRVSSSMSVFLILAKLVLC